MPRPRKELLPIENPTEALERRLRTLTIEKEDFALIPGPKGKRPEPTKDLILKLSNAFKMLDTKITEDPAVGTGDETIYSAHARVTIEVPEEGIRRTGEGKGKAQANEKDFSHTHHDAYALAETRALKRAFELALGQAFINQQARVLFPELMGGKTGEDDLEEIAATKIEIQADGTVHEL